jgi:hypothetical protein
MFLSPERPGVNQVQVSAFYDFFANCDFTSYPGCFFAAPYGFGAFFFQCGAVRSSEWCVKKLPKLLLKRTISRLCIRYQTCGHKTNDITYAAQKICTLSRHRYQAFH